jgi:hypothetical protein
MGTGGPPNAGICYRSFRRNGAPAEEPPTTTLYITPLDECPRENPSAGECRCVERETFMIQSQDRVAHAAQREGEFRVQRPL